MSFSSHNRKFKTYRIVRILNTVRVWVLLVNVSINNTTYMTCLQPLQVAGSNLEHSIYVGRLVNDHIYIFCEINILTSDCQCWTSSSQMNRRTRPLLRCAGCLSFAPLVYICSSGGVKRERRKQRRLFVAIAHFSRRDETRILWRSTHYELRYVHVCKCEFANKKNPSRLGSEEKFGQQQCGQPAAPWKQVASCEWCVDVWWCGNFRGMFTVGLRRLRLGQRQRK